jgi:Putative zinc-finger
VSDSPDCRTVADLVPELALGIATGEERAHALSHLASCPACRRLLDDMSGVADELLLLGPSHEPPVGFESRVIDRLEGARRRRWPRVTALSAAAAVLAAGVGVAGTLFATREERALGSSYARTLAAADGRYFSAAPLRTAGGGDIGHAFGYEGSPSWLFVTVADPGRKGVYTVRIVRGARRWDVGTLELRNGLGRWGGVLRHGFHGVDAVELVDARGSDDRLVASF